MVYSNLLLRSQVFDMDLFSTKHKHFNSSHVWDGFTAATLDRVFVDGHSFPKLFLVPAPPLSGWLLHLFRLPLFGRGMHAQTFREKEPGSRIIPASIKMAIFVRAGIESSKTGLLQALASHTSRVGRICPAGFWRL